MLTVRGAETRRDVIGPDKQNIFYAGAAANNENDCFFEPEASLSVKGTSYDRETYMS